jgi:hypothetical protein
MAMLQVWESAGIPHPNRRSTGSAIFERSGFLIAERSGIHHHQTMSAIEPPGAPKSKTGLIFGCVGCGCLTVIVGVAAAVVFGLLGLRKLATESDVYKDSLTAIEANPAAMAAVGTPLEPGWMIQANFSFDNGNETVDMTIPVTGPKGAGTIRAVASKSAGSPQWEYSTWQLDVEGGDSIPLGH